MPPAARMVALWPARSMASATWLEAGMTISVMSGWTLRPARIAAAAAISDHHQGSLDIGQFSDRANLRRVRRRRGQRRQGISRDRVDVAGKPGQVFDQGGATDAQFPEEIAEGHTPCVIEAGDRLSMNEQEAVTKTL